MSILSFLLALTGFACLAAAMSRHFQVLTGRNPARRDRLALRMAGWAFLAASLAPSLAWFESPVGLVAWFGVLNAAALVAALGLSLVTRSSNRGRSA